MSGHCYIGWEKKNVAVRRVATESQAKGTLVKIELLVSDRFDLTSILERLDEARAK